MVKEVELEHKQKCHVYQAQDQNSDPSFVSVQIAFEVLPESCDQEAAWNNSGIQNDYPLESVVRRSADEHRNEERSERVSEDSHSLGGWCLIFAFAEEF